MEGTTKRLGTLRSPYAALYILKEDWIAFHSTESSSTPSPAPEPAARNSAEAEAEAEAEYDEYDDESGRRVPGPKRNAKADA